MADLTKNINVGVDASGVKTGLQEATKSIKDFGKTVQDESNKGAGGVDRLGESVKKLGPATDSSMKASERAFKGWSSEISRAATQIQAAGDKVKEFELKAQLKGFTPDMYKPQIDALRGVIAEQDRLRASNTNLGMSAAATAAALRNVPAQFTDIVVSLQAGQAPLTVLLQQGGQLKDMFGGAGNAAKALGGYVLSLINPFSLLAAGAAAVAAAYAVGAKENEAFVRAMAVSGNATGTTRTQLREYAREIDNVVGTQAQAAEGLATFVAAGVQGSNNLRQFTQTAIEWEKATGQAVEDTAKQFADLQKDPLTAVVKLNESMNFLTSSIYDQIKSLDDQGRSAEAAQVAMNALDSAMRERGQNIKSNLGYIERGWNGIKSAAKDAWDAMLNVGRAATLNDRLGDVRKELNSLMNQQSWGETGGGAATGRVTAETKKRIQDRIEALRAEEWQLESTSAAEQLNAVAKEASAKATQSAIGWSQLYDKHKAKEVQRTEELAQAGERYKERLKDSNLTEKERNRINEEYVQIQKDIEDKYADKKKSGRNKELEAENREMERQKKLIGELSGLSSTFYRDWDDLSAAYEKGRLTLQGLTDQQAKLLAKQPFMVAQAKEEAEALREKQKALDAEKRAQEAITNARLSAANAVSGNVQKLKDDIAAARMSYSQNISLARALEMVVLARTEDALALEKQKENNETNIFILEEEIKKRKELIGLLGEKETFDKFKQSTADATNEAKQMMDSVGDALANSLMDGGKSASEYIKGLLRTLFVKPFVMNIVTNLFGSGGLLGGIGSLLGMNGGSGGGTSLLNMASNGSSLYGLASGSTFTTAGGWMTSAGNYMGWDWLSNAGTTVGGWGAASASPYAAYGANYASPATMGVVNVPGSSSMGAYAGVGYAAAIVMAAAYLGGMFKEEKQVGSGITGELGGDLYGYQLMRESGGLFDGPDYRYVVAEKEIEKSKAEIERLKKEISDNPNDARNGYRERQLQQQYSRLEMLSQYDGAIEASKGPIKILQDAFTAMREDTAARADSLKLDGDSIRAMKVTLGLDEIHPDTGGKGLELTGLSQEEAAAKIQAALAQANEEMARSVLGTWQEQTREVTRMVWDNVELPSDGDTQQYGRVGREVTDTVTEQVFVMSEYVRAGETAVQALTRLSDSLLSVNTVFDMLGVTLMDTSLAGADLASDIIDAFGGGDKFSAATSNYYDKFYSDQEKAQNQARLLNEQLKKLGVETMPASREALREYINGIDLSSEEGRKLYASLLGLVDVFDLIYTSAENIASLKQDLNVQLLRAQGNDAEALRLEREKQIKELEKYNDPELVRMQRDVWAAEDKTKADEEAKQAAETAKALGMKNLEAAVSREKEYWNQFSADAKDSLTKASSYFDLVTNAAKSLRDSVEDSASWSAAAGMVYIEQALDRARKGGGLSDLDATKSAIEAATGGLVMDNYATQAELDYDKKVLAGQLDELGGYAELAKSDAQKQIDLANAQIKRLDDTLTFWKEYGEEQVDATLSVTDAVNALYKLLDPKEQERIRKEEAEKAGLGGGGATPGYTPSGGGSLGGQVTGSNRVTVVGLTADGRAIFSNGEIGQTPAGQTSYNSTGQMNSNGYSLAEFERFKASGEFEFDPATGQWRKRASFAIGTNYVPRDMTANIHQGERIIPAADNRALMAALGTQGGGNAELITAVKKLEERLASIDHNTASSAISGQRLDDNFNQVTEGGNGMRVVNPA